MSIGWRRLPRDARIEFLRTSVLNQAGPLPPAVDAVCYFIASPVVAFTKGQVARLAAAPHDVPDGSAEPRSVGQRDAYLLAGVSLQPSGCCYGGGLEASSELMENSVIWNGRLCGVGPLQACAPRALTPLWMSLP